MEKVHEWLYLDFPSRAPDPCPAPPDLLKAFNTLPLEVLASVRDYLVVFPDQSIIANLKPNLDCLQRLDKVGVIVTASADECDFVSRFFCPQQGIIEDPVTGSSHCTLVPYWSRRLGRTVLTARQLSSRGGELRCRDLGSRVKIGGQAVTFSHAWIEL